MGGISHASRLFISHPDLTGFWNSCGASRGGGVWRDGGYRSIGLETCPVAYLRAAQFGTEFAFEAADNFFANFARVGVREDMVECLKGEGVGK